MAWVLVGVLASAAVVGGALLAEAATQTIYPSGISSTVGWVTSPSADQWGTYLDGNDTTNIAYSSAANDVFLVDMDSPGTSQGTVSSVEVVVMARGNTTSGMDDISVAVNGTGYLYINGVANSSATVGRSNAAYAAFSSGALTTNPATGSAWTWTDITNMTAGAKHINVDGTFTRINVTQVYAIVTYANGSLTVSQGADAGRPTTKVFGEQGVDKVVDELSLAATNGPMTLTSDRRARPRHGRHAADRRHWREALPRQRHHLGQWDGTDTQLGTTQTFSGQASGSTATFSGLSLAIPAARPRRSGSSTPSALRPSTPTSSARRSTTAT